MPALPGKFEIVIQPVSGAAGDSQSSSVGARIRTAILYSVDPRPRRVQDVGLNLASGNPGTNLPVEAMQSIPLDQPVNAVLFHLAERHREDVEAVVAVPQDKTRRVPDWIDTVPISSTDQAVIAVRKFLTADMQLRLIRTA